MGVLSQRVAGSKLLIVAALGQMACSQSAVPLERPIVRLVSDQFVANLSKPFLDEVRQSLPTIDVRLVEGSGGSTRATEAIQRGEADLGFSQADVAYFAYRRFAEDEVDQLRGMAALQVAPLHLVARAGLSIDGVEDLRNLRVRVGPAMTGQALLTDLVIGAYGLDSESYVASQVSTLLFADTLEQGLVDAAFAVGYYPLTPVVQATSRGARLLSIDGETASQLRRDYPFIRRVTIPADTYPGQRTTVNTIGVARTLICRRDLDETIVHDLTKAFLEALPRLAASLGTSIRTMDMYEAAATPIPLHPGAARYHREQELTR